MLHGNVSINQKSGQQANLASNQSKQRTQTPGNTKPFASLLPGQNTFSFSAETNAQNNVLTQQSATRKQLAAGQATPPVPAALAVSGTQHVASMQTAVQQNINKRNVQSEMPKNILQSNTTSRTKRAVTKNPSRGYAFGMEDTRIVGKRKNTPTPQVNVAQPVNQQNSNFTQTAQNTTGSKNRVQLLLPHLLKRANAGFAFNHTLPDNKKITTQQKNTYAAQQTVALQSTPQPLYKGTNAFSQSTGAPAQLAALHSANTLATPTKMPAQNANVLGALPTGTTGAAALPFMGAGMNGLSANSGAGALTPAALNKILGSQPTETGVTFGAVPHPTAYLRGGENPAEMALRTASHKRNSKQEVAPKTNSKQLILAQNKFEPTPATTANATTQPLGQLVARFESGSEGISAIGYDGVGGTSYGKYQISSRKGTMKRFIGYLQENAPDLATRLAKTGAANTGGRSGRMPNMWKQLATEDPARFEQLQDDFIQKTHLDPAVQGIADNSGISFNSLPSTLKEVLFSTAVQHGPSGAIRIVTRALKRVGNLEKPDTSNAYQSIYNNGKQLIKDIYAIRARQFGSSTAEVQAAVKSRLNKEMQVALTMFNEHAA